MKGTVIAVLMIVATLTINSVNSFGASAKCVVVEKKGTILVMDCGDRSKGFSEKGRVKIKTDRDSQ